MALDDGSKGAAGGVFEAADAGAVRSSCGGEVQFRGVCFYFLVGLLGCSNKPPKALLSRPAQVEVGEFSDAMVAVDYNGDGKKDLIVSSLRERNTNSNHGNPIITLFLGRGDGSFFPFKTTDLRESVCDLLTSDFNRDSLADIFVTHCSSNTASLWLGQSDGQFVQKQFYRVGKFPAYSVVNDFNNDGFSDVAVANQESDEITIFIGDGRGQLVANLSIFIPGKPTKILSTDFDGDGRVDLAVTHHRFVSSDPSARTTQGLVAFLRGHGDGNFESVNLHRVDFEIDDFICGDFNQDGLADLVVVNGEANSFELLANEGKFNFSISNSFRFGRGNVSEYRYAADLNADGKLDVVGFSKEGILVWANSGRGDFFLQDQIKFPLPREHEVGSRFEPARRPSAMVVDDFNNDFKPDIAITDTQNSSLLIFLNTTSGKK